MPTEIRFGIIGLGLMGREFASAAARWIHLSNLDVRPVLVAVCDTNETAFEWFRANVPTINFTTTNYQELLQREDIDVIYCAVPHHLHGQFYSDIINSGKHLMGEKPFGIDLAANRRDHGDDRTQSEGVCEMLVRNAVLPWWNCHHPSPDERGLRADHRGRERASALLGHKP